MEEFHEFSRCFINLYACSAVLVVHLMIPLTCDLPDGAEHVEFFWIQRFDIVIDVPVNENGRSERQKQKYVCYILVFSMKYMLLNQTNGKSCFFSSTAVHTPNHELYVCLKIPNALSNARKYIF